MPSARIVTLTPETIADYGVCGYKHAKKHKELQKKIEWYARYYPLGARICVAVAPDESYQGMIEYLPGQYAHRPVDAKGYLFIHCIFVGFNKEYKGHGYGSLLLSTCIKDAKASSLDGVAAVARKGPFMAGTDIFFHNGFVPVGTSKPDFTLMAMRFNADAPYPSFKASMADGLSAYRSGLFVLRSPQCPYTEKNVNAIIDSARREFGITATIVDLDGHDGAQASPCAFGTFCIILDGEILSHHPISNTRFMNIMKKRGG